MSEPPQEQPLPESRELIQKLGKEEALVAAVPKDAFRAMFYLFAGKPDSKVRLFKRKIVVRLDDLTDLNKKIIGKLRLHSIDQSVSTAIVKIDKETIIEFGTWAEFEAFDWKIPAATQEITLRWDFLIKLDAFAVPQRHTLTVRIALVPTPKDVFQMMMSQEPDADDISSKLGLCVARVDFISHRLADELLAVVGEWNESVPQPESANWWYQKAENYDDWIAHAIHFSMPPMFALLACAALSTWIPAADVTPSKHDLLNFGRWLLASILVVFLVNRFARWIASRCYQLVNEYGAFIPFDLTRGDQTKAKQLASKNSDNFWSFVRHILLAFILNVAAGVATVWLFPPAGPK